MEAASPSQLASDADEPSEPREARSRRPAPRKPLLPDGVLGMLIFLLTEVMLFMGLISAFLIVKATAQYGWPPPDQPRLPIEATAANSAVLLFSGLALAFAERRFAKDAASARAPFAIAILLGATFVLVQGGEWASLLGQGLTITSSPLGGFFYLIVGCHGLHAVAAIVALTVAFGWLLKGTLTRSRFWTVQALWYFVVGIWPILYVEVYL
ncbi:MAG: heme-copper oxidase subunit III [Sandaracinaceae bacterium]